MPPTTAYPRLVTALLTVLVFVTGGCGFSPLKHPSTPKVGANSARPRPVIDLHNLPSPRGLNPAHQSTSGLSPDELAPIHSGPGVLIAEADGPAGLRDLGAGCGRWLQIAVGSQKEFGSTPSWGNAFYLAHQLGMEHLRLRREHLKAAHHCLGVSHVGLGTISGSVSRPVISYRLYSTETGKAVGPAASATGSRDSLRSSLPGIAEKLIKQLGVKATVAPMSESGAELSTLGAIPWWAPRTITKHQKTSMEKLRGHSALALVMMIAHHAATPNAELRVTMGSRPNPYWNNLIVASEYLTHVARYQDFGRKCRQFLESQLKSNPNNHLMCLALASSRASSGEYAVGRALAEYAVRYAPKNPRGWVMLSNISREQAQGIRGGRTVDAMSEAKMTLCQELYDTSLAYTVHAVELNPQSAHLWVELSKDATFAGDEEMAKGALDKAVELESSNPLPDEPQLYRWAFQVYQPKWYEDREAAHRLGTLAVAEVKRAGEAWAPVDRVGMAKGLTQCGESALAQKLLQSEKERLWLQKELGE